MSTSVARKRSPRLSKEDAEALSSLCAQQGRAVKESKQRLNGEIIAFGASLAQMKAGQGWRRAQQGSFAAWAKAVCGVDLDMANLYIAASRVRLDWFTDPALPVSTLATVGKAPEGLRETLAQVRSGQRGITDAALRSARLSGALLLKEGADLAAARAHVVRVALGLEPSRVEPKVESEGVLGKRALRELQRVSKALRALRERADGSGPAGAEGWVEVLGAEGAALVDQLRGLLGGERRGAAREPLNPFSEEARDPAPAERDEAVVEAAPVGRVVTVPDVAAVFKVQLSADDQRRLEGSLYAAIKGKLPAQVFRPSLEEVCARIDMAAAGLPQEALEVWLKAVCEPSLRRRFPVAWQTFLSAQLPQWRLHLHSLGMERREPFLPPDLLAVVRAEAARTPMYTPEESDALAAWNPLPDESWSAEGHEPPPR